MCYTCSSLCDNCQPKFLLCPECGRACRLESETCSACGCAFSDELKLDFVEKWDAGERFGRLARPKIEPMSRTNSPFAPPAQ